MVTYSFSFINRQSVYKTNCIQSIERIAMWEVFSSIMSLIGDTHLRREGAYQLNSCPQN